MTVEPEAPLTWGAQLARAERTLATAGTPAPRDEAIELLGTLLGIPDGLLLARLASQMSQSDVAVYDSWVSRRAAGEELPRITGRLAFMGLELTVGRNSPLPTVGSRRLVEVALQIARRHPSDDLIAAEIGAGRGVVALALAALEPRFSRIYAVDSSAAALETMAANGARYLLNLVISWLEGDGPDSVPEPVDALICGQLEQSTPAATRLLEQAAVKLRAGGALICGFAGEQVSEAGALFQHALPAAYVWTDSHPDGAVLVAQLPSASTGDMTFTHRTRGGNW